MTGLRLSDDQIRVVDSDALALVVVAGAGSGKTEVVAQRIERLLRESEEDGFRVLALSYTVKAADELRERLSLRLGDLQRRVDADTMHGFALSLLRRHGTRIGLPREPEILTRDEDRVELLAEWLAESGQSLPAEVSAIMPELDLARAKGLDAPLLNDLREALAARGALDYPAMLDRATELVDGTWVGRNLRTIYGHVVVDEAQNLSPAQYRFLTSLVGQPDGSQLNAMLVGDERQSIVGFAGADSRLIAEFVDEYQAERVELRTNFRSARLIVDLGRAVSRELKQVVAVGEVVEFPANGSIESFEAADEGDEARFAVAWIDELLTNGIATSALAPGEDTHVRPEDIAVLSRAGGSLRHVRARLDEIGMPNASASAESDWVRSSTAQALIELIAYRSAPDHISTQRQLARLCGVQHGWDDAGQLFAAASERDLRELAGLATEPSPGSLLDRAALLVIDDDDWGDDLSQLQTAWESFLDRSGESDRTFGNFRQHIARCQRGDPAAPGVQLLTVHKSQGREFKAVVLVGCNDGQIPDFRAHSLEEAQAELRVFYVAVSRASRALLLTRAKARATRYGPRSTNPSPYLKFLSTPQSDRDY